jgi:hypothetical protein
MKKLEAIIAVALLVTLALGGSLWSKVRTERAQSAQLEARISSLEAEGQAAPPPASVPAPAPVPAAPEPAAAAPAVTRPAAPAVARVNAPPPSQTPPNAMAQAMDMLSTDAGRGMIRGILQAQYGDLGRELGLSEAETNKLFDVMARQQLDLTADAAGLLAGTVTDPNAMRESQRKVDEKTRANEAELAALLGDKYRSFQEYQATAAARQQVTQLQNMLGSANALTESQSKALVKAFSVVQARTLAEQRNAPAIAGSNSKEMLENQLKVVDENNRRLLEASSQHLTIAQYDIYKRQLEQQSSMLRMIMGPMGAGAGAGQAGAPR